MKMIKSTVNNKVFERRIPTIPAFIILIISIFVSSYVLQKGVFFVGKASPDTTPQSIKVTNVTDSSFTVTYQTGEKSTGAIALSGKNELTSLIYDDRDKPTGEQHPYYSHSITVPNLKPSTLYYFSIFSQSNKYLNKGQPYLIKTAPAITSPPLSQKPLFGKIILPDAQAGEDVLVYASFPNGQSISTISKSSGEYIIPTNSLRTSDLKSYLSLKNNTSIVLTAIRQDYSTKITIMYKNGEQVPLVTLSSNYDFSKTIAPAIVGTNSASLSVPEINSEIGTIKITVPQKNQSFTDKKPLFQGTAIPNNTVHIQITNSSFSADVKSDRNGFWSIRPSSPLDPGIYTLSIQTPNSLGITTKVQQSFSIFAAGSQLAFSEIPSTTPKATATLTPTPTLNPSPTIAISPSITPTSSGSISPSVSPVITLTPTSSPSPTPFVISSTPTPTFAIATPPLESPGSSSTIILSSISVVFIITGTLLLFML